MKIFNKLDTFINEKNYLITYKNDSINIVNYLKIINFSSSLIEIEHKNGITIINGKDLVISKLMEDELLIIGDIYSIEFKKS